MPVEVANFQHIFADSRFRDVAMFADLKRFWILCILLDLDLLIIHQR